MDVSQVQPRGAIRQEKEPPRTYPGRQVGQRTALNAVETEAVLPCLSNRQ